MTQLANWFIQAGALLGLRVERDFALLLSDGRMLSSVVRVSGLGPTNGVLVFYDYEAMRNDAVEVAALGYGFSIMGEPRFDEEFDLDSFKEMFADWGWSGDSSQSC